MIRNILKDAYKMNIKEPDKDISLEKPPLVIESIMRHNFRIMLGLNEDIDPTLNSDFMTNYINNIKRINSFENKIILKVDNDEQLEIDNSYNSKTFYNKNNELIELSNLNKKNKNKLYYLEQSINNSSDSNIMDSQILDELHNNESAANESNISETNSEDLVKSQIIDNREEILEQLKQLQENDDMPINEEDNKDIMEQLNEDNETVINEEPKSEIIYASNPYYKSKTKTSYKYNSNTIIYDFDSEYDIEDIKNQLTIFRNKFNALTNIQPGDKLSFDSDNVISLYKNEYLQSLKRWYYSENHEQTRINILCLWKDYNLFNQMVRKAMNEHYIQYIQYNHIVRNGGLHPTHESLIETCVKLIHLNDIISSGLKILRNTYNKTYRDLDKLFLEIRYVLGVHNNYLKHNYVMNFYNLYMSYKYK